VSAPRAPKAHTLRWTRRAEADLEAIGDYIAEDNPRAAERWVGKLLDKARAAAAAPLAGRIVPEIAMDSVREVFLRTYRIVYRVRGDEVQVLTVFEGHRRFPLGAVDDEDEEPLT
jgi:addiction module RelE/StbE family toxin